MFKKIPLLLLVCCAFMILPTTLPAAAADPKPVVIDSDMTSDDYMATLYLLNNPDVSVKAITVTGTGWAFCDAGVRAAQGLVALAAYASDVPVSCWTDKPLLGDSPVPDDWRTTMAGVDALKLPEGGAKTDLNAVDLFTKTIQDSPEKVTVLALGPLTNVAQALTTTPALV
ncbi:MAG: nucleoside hydrolase, partial [Chloroflexota bacterium]